MAPVNLARLNCVFFPEMLMKLRRRLALTVVLVVSAFTLAGCDWPVQHTGPLETMPINVALGSADRSKLEFDMAAGELNLSGRFQPSSGFHRL